MNVRSSLIPALVLALTAACGDSPPAETPANPSGEPAAAAPGTGAEAPVAPPAEPKKEEPPPVPAKQKIVGKWGFDVMASDPGKKFEEDAKKKAGKDEKKLAAAMKKFQDDAGKEWIEYSADTYTSYVGEKPVFKAKYEVAKEEGNAVTLKFTGKEEVSKKDAPKTETVVTVVDDSTLQIKDAKKGLLQFKKK